MTKHYLYRILVPDGGAYIGRTTRHQTRFAEHCRADTAIGQAIRHYGRHNCIFEILCVGSYQYIYELEELAIKEFNTWNPAGYNGHPQQALVEGRARFLNSLKAHTQA